MVLIFMNGLLLTENVDYYINIDGFLQLRIAHEYNYMTVIDTVKNIRKDFILSCRPYDPIDLNIFKGEK